MKNTKKTIVNITLFITLLVVTFYVIFKDQSIGEIINILRHAKVEYVLIGIICMLIYVLCEAINIKRTLKVLGEEITLISSIKYALIGFFFSGITPAASGGQPMQIYYMYKDKITVANSTLTLLINLTCVQIVTISIALISVIFNHQYLNKAMIIFFIIGILLNASALSLLLISIFSKKLLRKLMDFVIMIMRKMKLKNIEQKIENLENEITKYQDSSIYIKNNKLVILKTVMITYIQFFAFYSVSYWVYRSFGFNQYNIMQILMLQAVLYGAVSGIPSPGAVGVTEGGFIAIFSYIYNKNMVNSVMLLNRGINFYFLIIFSGVVTFVNMLNSTNKNLKVEKS